MDDQGVWVGTHWFTQVVAHLLRRMSLLRHLSPFLRPITNIITGPVLGGQVIVCRLLCVWEASGKWKANAVTPDVMGEHFAYPLCEDLVRNSRDEAMKAVVDWWHSHERTDLRFQLSVLGALTELNDLLRDSSVGEEAEQKRRIERRKLRMNRVV